MKPFSRQELFGLGVIFLVLILVSVPNFVLSLRRARDQVRLDDMGATLNALGSYDGDFGVFPQNSPDGRIMACVRPGYVPKKDKNGHLVIDFIPCDWGVDAITDITQPGGKIYMPLLPRDPNYKKGAAYRYISDGTRFQIYASLEGKDEAEYDPKIVARNLMCGNLICNSGRASGDTRTDIPLSIYEVSK